MNELNNKIDNLISKFADYCACDEYHYGEIYGWPGNHDPKDGHMEFDEEAFSKAIEALITEQVRLGRIDELKRLPISDYEYVSDEGDETWFEYISVEARDKRLKQLKSTTLLEGEK